jgi:hypothetical protein
LEEQRQQEIGERADGAVAVREAITETMAASIDAGKVPTRGNERVTEEGKKKYKCAYRDSTVATVSAVEVDKEDAAHFTTTSCVTGTEHANEFFPRIEVEMRQRSREVGDVDLGDPRGWSKLDLGPRGRFGRSRAAGPAYPGLLACLRSLGENR